MKTFLVLALLAIAAIWFLGGMGQPAVNAPSVSAPPAAQLSGTFSDDEFQQWLSVNAVSPAYMFYCNGAGQAGVYTSCTVLDGAQMYTVRRVNGQLVKE